MIDTNIPISEFKAKCLSLVEGVASSGKIIIITKHGKPVAKVTQVSTSRKSLKGSWKGLVTVKGDIINCDTSDDWDRAREQTYLLTRNHRNGAPLCQQFQRGTIAVPHSQRFHKSSPPRLRKINLARGRCVRCRVVRRVCVIVLNAIEMVLKIGKQPGSIRYLCVT